MGVLKLMVESEANGCNLYYVFSNEHGCSEATGCISARSQMIIFKNCSDGAEINLSLMDMGVLKLMVESEGDLR